MKTYNGKTITKKHITAVLRSLNKTSIWQLVHNIYGGNIDSKQVYDFVREYAPTNKIYDMAYDLAYLHNRQKRTSTDQVRKSVAYYDANIKHFVLQTLRANILISRSAYAKRPMMGKSHLWFCSPLHGFNDYNKWSAMEIKGNERFCEVICRLADKYFPINND